MLRYLSVSVFTGHWCYRGGELTHPLKRIPITQAWDTAPVSKRASNGRPATAPMQISSNRRSRRFSRFRMSLG